MYISFSQCVINKIQCLVNFFSERNQSEESRHSEEEEDEDEDDQVSNDGCGEDVYKNVNGDVVHGTSSSMQQKLIDKARLKLSDCNLRRTAARFPPFCHELRAIWQKSSLPLIGRSVPPINTI